MAKKKQIPQETQVATSAPNDVPAENSKAVQAVIDGLTQPLPDGAFELIDFMKAANMGSHESMEYINDLIECGAVNRIVRLENGTIEHYYVFKG